jgi:hypothetical protein
LQFRDKRVLVTSTITSILILPALVWRFWWPASVG